ncbi:MAG: Sec-independent protein translocase protein TatB [Thiobacillaceae bacterium]|jgi:sec-independent protein translocase protein TatB
MFDIGFSELLLIGVVALIVIGPERLPKVARTAGHLFGRFQRYVNSVKSDISREMQLDELRKAGQSFKESVESAARNVENKAGETEYTIRDEVTKGKVEDALGLKADQANHGQGQGGESARPSDSVQKPAPSLDWNQPSEIAHSATKSPASPENQEKA